MKIKKRLRIALISVAVIAVLINTALMGLMTLRYFRAYLSENYESNCSQLIDYLSETMSGEYSVLQMNNELKTHLSDPIISISVYDAQENLIASVSESEGMGMNGMRGMYAHRAQETEQYDIVSQDTVIGTLLITRSGTVRNSTIVWQFRSALLRNGLISAGIVALLMLLGGALLSKNMSKDLTHTAEFAQTIDLGTEENALTLSKTAEIRVIQQSLLSLRSRLRMKQAARKTLGDELIHQSRTPLTILQTHLEAMEDGIVEMSQEEMKVCNEQIRTLTEIISNINGLIDAGAAEGAVRNESVEFNKLIAQIVNGLRFQFAKRSIRFDITCPDEKIMLHTDRHLLSQAIYNVLTNSLKYTQAGGEVRLRCGRENSKAILRIEDNGQGIGKEDVPYLFDAYRRGTDAQGEGEGLGLYIARSNLESIGGEINYEENVPRGSVFIIRMPIR